MHLPFNDGSPDALLIALDRSDHERNYVFRGRGGEWWSGQLCMSRPQPLLDAVEKLGANAP